MRCGPVAYLAPGLLLLATLTGFLAGCGRFGFEPREPWRAAAEEACLAAGLVVTSASMTPIPEIDGPGSCGMTHPFRATALADGAVGLTSRLTLACPIIPELNAWLRDTVQPAASLYLGQAVTEIRAGSYSCRPRNNQAGAKVSEHAFGNAVDVMAFRFADGRELTVKAGWRGEEAEQDFLREVFVGACRHFTTVLGPGADVFHHDHLHLDLARHDPAGRRHVCRPVLKFEPRIGPDTATTAPPPPASPSLAPVEIEADDDPFAISSAAPRRRPMQLQPRITAGAAME